jgi:cell division protease FtsH
VIVLAATNRPDILDPALLRPGRFDRHITVDLPALEDRLEILTIHSRNKPLDKDVSLKEIARGTPGFSGADLGNLLNEAAILAARKDKSAIGEEDIQEARDKVIMGLERKNLSISDLERKLLAYHEAGHAVVATLMPHADPVYKVTIIPRGRAMGVTQQLPEKEKMIYAKDHILDRLSVMLGGRAAEMLVFETSTSGAESDLKEAMSLTRKMVLDWGMGEGLINLALGGQTSPYIQDMGQRPDYSESTAGKIDEEVRKILDAAFTRALLSLKGHRKELDRVAAVLMEKEAIPGSEVVAIVKGHVTTEASEAPPPA